MSPASFEISIPEGVNARLALEWAVERLIRMIDAIDEVEDRERDARLPPSTCQLMVSISPTDLIHYSLGEDRAHVS